MRGDAQSFKTYNWESLKGSYQIPETEQNCGISMVLFLHFVKRENWKKKFTEIHFPFSRNEKNIMENPEFGLILEFGAEAFWTESTLL